MQGGAGDERAFFAVVARAILGLDLGEIKFAAAIERIAEHGQMHMVQMNANLVRAIREGQALEQSVAEEFRQHFEAGARGLAEIRLHAHEAGADLMRGDGRIDFKLVLLRRAMHERDVTPLRLVCAEDVGEFEEDGLVLREQQHAGSLEVEAVRVVEVSESARGRPRLAGGDAGVEQLHQTRAGRVVRIGRGEQARGLVEGEQVLVLEHDGDFPKLLRLGGREFDRRRGRR